MADGGSGIQQASEEVIETAREVAGDAKDAVGEAIEQGVQSVVGPKLTPQQIQQKQQEDQKKEIDRKKQLAYTRKWLKDAEMAQEKVRMENKRKEEQRLQNQQQEKQVTEMKKEEKKKKVNPALANVGKVEIKGGVGG